MLTIFHFARATLRNSNLHILFINYLKILLLNVENNQVLIFSLYIEDNVFCEIFKEILDVNAFFFNINALKALYIF